MTRFNLILRIKGDLLHKIKFELDPGRIKKRLAAMKSDIHPKYFDVTIQCACGAKYETKSTRSYSVDVCSACHPFFTGKAKLLDTEGRVERFRRKYQQKK